MEWVVKLVDEVEDWFLDLDPETSDLVADAIDLLEERGPALRQPMVKPIRASKHHNMKELRPGSAGRSEVRILFIFDLQRQAVLLVGGDKSGSWNDWYPTAIKAADSRYERWLAGDYSEER